MPIVSLLFLIVKTFSHKIKHPFQKDIMIKIVLKCLCKNKVGHHILENIIKNNAFLDLKSYGY